MYVNFTADGRSGGAKFNRTVLRMLEGIFRKVDLCEFPLETPPLRNLKNTLQGYLSGLDGRIAKGVADRAAEEAYDWVFLASSNFGRLAASLKRACPDVRICTLFNNIEYNFIVSRMKTERQLHLPLTLWATWRSERLIARYSDRAVVLNERERGELRRIYGREADMVMPIVLPDEWRGSPPARRGAGAATLTGLFVGSYFYANRHAVEWFARNVAPFTPDAAYEIVGSGFEAAKSLESANVRVVGGVEDVGEYYGKADFVIAPVFRGAGMKVKVAEAMMYGKTVVGSREAFEGYDGVEEYGVPCAGAADFIRAINSRKFPVGYNPAARRRFLEAHECGSVRGRLANLFAS